MSNSPLEAPEITFEQAIALTQSLLSQAEAGESPEMAAAITELVKTETGARGFFATYLTSDSAIADNPPTSVIQALQSSPDVVADLLVKNLAMSAAQAVFHRRNHKEDMAEASEQVRQRTTRLIELVSLPAVYDRSTELLESATTGEGSYKAFLERWGYDAEQRQVICKTLQQVNSAN
jgi:hypothetical protein